MADTIILKVELQDAQALAGLQNIDSLVKSLNSTPIRLSIQGGAAQMNAAAASAQKLATGLKNTGSAMTKLETTKNTFGETTKVVETYSHAIGEATRITKSFDAATGDLKDKTTLLTQDFAKMAREQEKQNRAEAEAVKRRLRRNLSAFHEEQRLIVKTRQARAAAMPREQRAYWAEQNQRWRTEDRSETFAGQWERAERERYQEQMDFSRKLRAQMQAEAKKSPTEDKPVGSNNSPTAPRKNKHLLGDSFGNIVAKMAAWQVLGATISSVIRSVTQAVGTMREVDSELTNIRKVTGMTAEETKELGNAAYSTASKFGVSANEYLQSVTVFSKAGYKEMSKDLGELAIKTQLVGDVSAEMASKFLLSVDAGYQMGGSITKLSGVLDKANEIENNYATSIEKIAEGMPIVASVANTAHMSIEETMAALGTITATTQESGTMAARALRALILNIMGDTKTEIEEGVSWTENEVKTLNDVLWKYSESAMKAAQASGEVVNPMEAIAGLSRAFKEGVLTEAELVEIVTDLGGKLRTNQLLALIKNFETFTGMMDTMGKAAGSADKEVEVMLSSWDAKSKILQNTWTEFLTNFVNSDLAKGAIDGLTGFIKVLGSDGGVAALQIAAVTAGVAGLAKGAKALAGLSIFKDIGAFFSLAKGGGLAGALSLLSPTKLAIAGVVAAVTGAIALVDHLNVTAEEAAEKAEEMRNQYEQDYGAGTRYDELISKQETLNALERQELENLERKKQLQEEAIRAAEEEAYLKWQESYGTGAKTHLDIYNEEVGTYESVTTTQDVAELHNFYTELANIGQELQSGAVKIEDFHGAFGELLTDQTSYVDELEAWKAKGFELSEAQEQQINLVKSLIDVYDGGLLPIEEFGAAMAISMQASGLSAEDAVTRAGQLVDAVKQIMDAEPEVNIEDNAEETKASIDTVGAEAKKIADADYKIWFTVGHDPWPKPPGGKYQFAEDVEDAEASGTTNAPGGPTLVNELGPELISANGRAYIAGGGEPTITDLPRGAIVLDANKTKRALGGGIPALAGGAGIVSDALDKINKNPNSYTDNQGFTWTLDEDGNYARNPRHPEDKNPSRGKRGGAGDPGGGAGGGGSSGPDFKSLEDALKNTLSNLDAQAELAENEGRFVDAMKIYNQAQDEISALLDKYREAGYADDSDEVLALANKGYDYAGKQTGTYDKLQKDLIDALNDLTKATDDANKLEERKQAVEEAKEALANAEKQRTVRIFNPVTGQWEWIADSKDVQAAQERLKDAEKSLKDEEIRQSIDAIKNGTWESIGDIKPGSALAELINSGTDEQKQAIANALGILSGGVDFMGSDEGKSEFNSGDSHDTYYEFPGGVVISEDKAATMTVKELAEHLKGLAAT